MDICKEAKRKYQEMLRRDTEGVTPLYREKSYKRIEGAEEKEKNQFRSRREESEAVFIVKATPRVNRQKLAGER